MERFNLLKIAEESLDGDNYCEDHIGEVMSKFKCEYAGVFELKGSEYREVQTLKDEPEKGIRCVDTLLIRDDGKYFALDRYDEDEYGRYSTQPEFLTEVKVKEVATISYSYTIRED